MLSNKDIQDVKASTSKAETSDDIKVPAPTPEAKKQSNIAVEDEKKAVVIIFPNVFDDPYHLEKLKEKFYGGTLLRSLQIQEYSDRTFHGQIAQQLNIGITRSLLENYRLYEDENSMLFMTFNHGTPQHFSFTNHIANMLYSYPECVYGQCIVSKCVLKDGKWRNSPLSIDEVVTFLQSYFTISILEDNKKRTIANSNLILRDMGLKLNNVSFTFDRYHIIVYECEPEVPYDQLNDQYTSMNVFTQNMNKYNSYRHHKFAIKPYQDNTGTVAHHYYHLIALLISSLANDSVQRKYGIFQSVK